MQFVNEFNTITGENLSDLLKNYHNYLTKHELELERNLDVVLSNYHPENDLQNIFKLGIINKFKRKEDALQILKSGNVINIKRVLNWAWVFQDVDTADFLANVIPHYSYSLRIKATKKYSRYLKNTEKAEQIFEGLKCKYGQNLAFIILPACSEKFIRSTIPSFSSQIPYAVLKVIYKKYPEPIVEYLEYVLEGKKSELRKVKKFNLDKYEGLFKMLAVKDSKRFIDMYDKYKSIIEWPYTNIGRRCTKYILSHHKEAILKDFDNYSSLIHIKKLIPYLSIDEIKQLQLGFCKETTITYFNSFWSHHNTAKLIKYTTSIKKYNCEQMIVDNFEQAYKRKLKVEDFLSAPIGAVMESVQYFPMDLRIESINALLPKLNAINKATIIPYLPTETSIPMLKKMIENEPDVYRRRALVKSIMKTITFNKDIKNIPLIIKYFNTRFRNDQEVVKYEIRDQLCNMKDLLYFLDFDDWKPIETFYDLYKLNTEHSLRQPYEYSVCDEFQDIFQVRIKKCFELGIPVEKYLKHFSQNFVTKYYNYSLLKNTSYQKYCLEWFIKNIKPDNIEEKSPEEQITSLFCAVFNYNGEYQNKLDIPDWLIEKAVEILNKEDDNSCKSQIMWSCSTLELRHKIFPSLLLSSQLPQYDALLIYSLKYEHSKLLNSLDQVLENILDNSCKDVYQRFFKLAKLYTSFGIPQKMIVICLKHLKITDNTLRSSKAVNILSILLPTDKFLGVVSKYFPKEGTVEDFSAHNRAIYEIQKSIAEAIKNISIPEQGLNVLKTFAVGDYLKLVIGSISRISCHVPEDKVIPLLKQWFDSPVSARKNFYRCFCKIAPLQENINFFKNFQTEKNSSLRLVLFELALKLFIDEPNQDTFDCYYNIVCNLNAEDMDLVSKAYDVSNIPDEYVSKYLRALWDLTKNKNDSSKEKVKLINLITKDLITLLENEFCDSLVNEVFLLKDSSLLVYLSIYLLFAKDKNEQGKRLQNILKPLRNEIKGFNDFDCENEAVFPVRKMITNIISDLCEKCRSESRLMDVTNLLKALKSNLDLVFKEEHGHKLPLEQTLIIDFTILFKEKRLENSKDESRLQHFVNFVKDIFKEHSVYDITLLNYLTMPEVINYDWLKTNDLFKLAEMLLSENHVWCHLLALDVLPKALDDEDSIELYQSVIKKMLKNDQPMVQQKINVILGRLSSYIKITEDDNE